MERFVNPGLNEAISALDSTGGLPFCEPTGFVSRIESKVH